MNFELSQFSGGTLSLEHWTSSHPRQSLLLGTGLDCLLCLSQLFQLFNTHMCTCTCTFTCIFPQWVSQPTLLHTLSCIHKINAWLVRLHPHWTVAWDRDLLCTCYIAFWKAWLSSYPHCLIHSWWCHHYIISWPCILCMIGSQATHTAWSLPDDVIITSSYIITSETFH